MVCVIEIPETDIRLGLTESGEEVVMTINDVEEARWDAYDTHCPPCCAICLEDGNMVEPDGRCEHNEPSYQSKVLRMA